MKESFITGEKIYLRALYPEDLEKGYHDWINDPETNRFIMGGIFPTPMARLKEYYEKVIASDNDVMFAIVDKKTDTYIGNIKLGGIDWVNRVAHCGRMIGDKRYWGKGYGTEALSLVLDYAFMTLNLNKVYNIIVEGNAAALKSCEKLGMKKEGRFSQARFIDTGYKDAIQVAITRDAYTGLRGRNCAVKRDNMVPAG